MKITENCEKIRKIWMKNKLNSEKVWKYRNNSEMIWKIWKKRGKRYKKYGSK
jgi:hypothetical protein